MRDKYRRPALGPQGTGLKTSAMIASIAGPDQRTRPAPFGHALVATEDKLLIWFNEQIRVNSASNSEQG